MVTRLQDENRRLAQALQESRSDSEDSGKQSTNPTNPLINPTAPKRKRKNSIKIINLIFSN